MIVLPLEKILYKYFPILLLFFVCIFSPFLRSGNYDFLMGEKGIIEISQVIIIIYSLFLNIKSKNVFYKNNNKYAYYLKNILLLFILYEELSFITSNLFGFLEVYNLQSELNFHNSKFLVKTIFNEFSLFGLNLFNKGVTLNKFLYILFLLFFGFGSFFTFFRPIRLIFLDKRFSFYSLIFILNHLLSFVVRKMLTAFGSYDSTFILVHYELMELFIYTIIMLDIIFKKNFYPSSFRSNINQNIIKWVKRK